MPTRATRTMSDILSTAREFEDEMSLHPEQLSRRISEIDLSCRGPRDVLPEFRPVYPRTELLRLRSASHDGSVDPPDLKLDGIMTPPSISHPDVPPASPADISPEGGIAIVNGGGNDHEDEGLTMANGEAKKKKKKNSSRKGKSKKGITGFEEFYADPPITPDEHEEECDLYDQSIEFHEYEVLPSMKDNAHIYRRIQTCIQRYRRRRNLNEARAFIFTKFLMLGGVEASPSKAFTGGLDKDTIENSTAAEIAAIQATDFVRAGTTNSKYYDPLDPEGWVVDFEGVAKGFLSNTAPQRIGSTDMEIKLYCSVVKNFLNYVLAHAVCPEYTNNVLAARNICDLAEKELLSMNLLRRELPGDFSIAASTLYGGRYKEIQLANEQWDANDPPNKTNSAADQGFGELEAQSNFKTAIALSGTDDMFEIVMAEEVKIISSQYRYMEVVKIEPPSPETVAQYLSVAKAERIGGCFKALGLLHVKPWGGPGIVKEDMTDDEDNEQSTPIDGTIDTFWLEDDTLKHCFIGLKMEVMVQELNIGIKFFDDIPGFYCSFFTFLPNEKMVGWREPIPNTRAPPTVNDPDVEEKVMIGEIENDIKDHEKLGEKLTIKTTLASPAEMKDTEGLTVASEPDPEMFED